MIKTEFDERLFAEFYDVNPQAIVWLKPIWADNGVDIVDFVYTYANAGGLKYLNMSPRQFEGITILNSPTLNDELRKMIFEELLMVFKTNTRSTTTIYNPILKKYAHILRSKLRDGVLTVIQDITQEQHIIAELEAHKRELEEKTAELQKQSRLLNNILEKSSNGISVSQVFRDEKGIVVDALTNMANDAAVKFIGLPKDIYLTKRVTEIDPDIFSTPYYQQCIRTLETGEPFITQYYLQATSRWLELTVSKMDYDHLIHIFTDVTSVKQAQISLEKAATTLRTVFDSAQSGMFTIAPEYKHGKIYDFRFVMVNSSFSSYAGQNPNALEGCLVSEWFSGYLKNGLFDMYRETMETGVTSRRELHYIDDRLDNYIDVQAARIDDQVLVCLTDLTTLRKSQLELEQSVKALQRSNTYLEDFAHVASHDLKEPLRKILTFSDRLKISMGDRVQPNEMVFFDRIKNSAERMQLLVDDLLEFSHLKMQPDVLEMIDLNIKLRNVLSDLELNIEEKNAVVEVADLPVIRGNRRQIQQLFQNIIGNALKYSKPDAAPVIKITSEDVLPGKVYNDVLPEHRDKKYHLIRIVDNGIGFDQEYSEKIFDIFQRLHKKSEYSGTGIGLSIARKVVENHNGYVWAEGKAGVGATFNILLPVANA